MTGFCALLLLGALFHVRPLPASLGEYQIILDKQLLGRPPPPPRAEPPPPEPPAPATPGWANEYRMTMITYDDFSQSIRVGLQNVRDNSGFLLIKGETYPGHRYVLVDGDIHRGQATISFQGQQHRFSLESGPEPTDSTPSSARGGRTRPSPPSQPEPARVRRVPRPPQRQDQNEEPEQQSRFQSPEELQAHLENVQMDAIRTGKPPLPIPLTQEMDDELVREGVLPPQ